MLLLISYRHISLKRSSVLVGLSIFGLFSAGFYSDFSLTTRIGEDYTTIIDQQGFAHDRMLIWSQSLELLKQSPWLGHGFGLFWLIYPGVSGSRSP